MLDLQIQRYRNGEKYLSTFDMNRLLTPLKKQSEYQWLNNISVSSLQNVCADLNNSYISFFKKRSKFPKFKSRKRSKPTFPVGQDKLYFANECVAQIPKIGKMKYKTDFSLPLGRDVKFYNPHISFVNNKWIFSFDLMCENQAHKLNNKPMGIDLGIKELATVAYGNEKLVFHNINKSKCIKQLKQKQKRLQRSISRKYEKNRIGKKYIKTKNIVKQENQLRKVYSRISNIRHNYIHQTTHHLISLYPSKIIMEDINVTKMMKDKHLSQLIQEQNFHEFIRQMKYKCEWNGIEFVQADRFYPSSKTCSCCGEIKNDLRLSDRIYVCDKCGAIIDRDFNAALNLSRYVA